MPSADYEGFMATGYDAGRGLTDEGIESWTVAVAPLFAGLASAPILDLGAGTGRFSGLLHTWSGSSVVAVEPASKMRRRLFDKRLPGVVGVVGAAAEALPFPDQSFEAAWLSQVVHHFDDLDQAARELGRTVRADGRVLIRGVFARDAEYGRSVNALLYQYFPDALRRAQQFPVHNVIVTSFATGGFSIESASTVEQVVAPSLRDYCERVRLRADSTLAAIDDREFEVGLRALEADAGRETSPSPVLERVELLVLRRGS